MNLLSLRRSNLALTISMALTAVSLTACGGGSAGNVKETPPPVSVAVPPTSGSGTTPAPTTPDTGTIAPPTTPPTPDNGGITPPTDPTTPEAPDNGGTTPPTEPSIPETPDNGGTTPPTEPTTPETPDNGGTTPPTDPTTPETPDNGGTTPPTEPTTPETPDPTDPGTTDPTDPGTPEPTPPVVVPPTPPVVTPPVVTPPVVVEPTPDPNTPVAAPTAAYRAHLDVANVTSAWNSGSTGQGQIVGIIDNGVSATNPTLEGQIAGQTTISVASDPSFDGGNVSAVNAGHGTAVAQIIVGNRVGAFQQGVAYDAQAYSIKVGGDDGKISLDAATAAIEAMSASGVRIVNNSWNMKANPGFFDMAALDRLAAAAYDHVVNHNGLFVWANGNEGAQNPGLLSRLPRQYSYSELYYSWLTVGAVDENLELAAYSNACGYAKNWCLVAPGSVVVMDANAQQGDATYGYNEMSGTSFAAPQVSAAAALLMAKYPWMTSANVQNVLLTTATDLGAVGVDDVFGHGLLNTGKAINGPSSFLTSQTFNVDAGTYSFSNDIVVPSYYSMTKAGVGTLVLSGNNVINAGMSVTGGTLANTGSITSVMNVEAGGAYAGNGVFNGNIGSKGTIRVAGGDMTINGVLDQANGSITEFELGSVLNVQTLSPNGTVSIVGLGQDYVVPGTQRLVNTGEFAPTNRHAINPWVSTGTYDDLVFDASLFLTGTLSYSPTTVDVVLEAVPALAQAALTSTRFDRANAQQLDAAFATANRFAAQPDRTVAQSAFVASLAQAQQVNTPTAALAVMDSVSGQGRIMANQALLESQQATDALANQRLQSIAALGTGAWATMGQTHGSLSPSGWAGTSYQSTDWAAGWDGQAGNAVVGVAGYKGRTDVSMRRSQGSADVDTWGVGIYTQATAGKWVMSGQVRYQSGSMDAERSTVFADGTLRHSQDLEQFSFQAEAGRPVAISGSTLTPFASLRHHRLHVGGTEDQGLAGLGLTTAAESYAETTARIGSRFERSITDGTNGVWWKWDGVLAYERVVDAASTGLTAAYLGAPDETFRLQGASMDRNAWVWGVGVQGGRQATRWFVRWDGVRSSHSETQGVSAGVKIAF